jgi:hypothetical protein
VSRSFDTAVREACLVLEVFLKEKTNAAVSYGVALIEHYVAYLRSDKRVIESQVKWIRTELRACFAFVRNPYMHNFHVISEEQCIALLCRISILYLSLMGIESVGSVG